jgi:hypothetical protein
MKRPSEMSAALPIGAMELERDRFGFFAESEGTRAAEEELEEFKPPRDPAP